MLITHILAVVLTAVTATPTSQVKRRPAYPLPTEHARPSAAPQLLVRRSGAWVLTGSRRFSPRPPLALTKHVLAVAKTVMGATLTTQVAPPWRHVALALAGLARGTPLPLQQSQPALRTTLVSHEALTLAGLARGTLKQTRGAVLPPTATTPAPPQPLRRLLPTALPAHTLSHVALSLAGLGASFDCEQQRQQQR